MSISTTETKMGSTTTGGKNMLTIPELDQRVQTSKAREAVGILPDGRKCVIQQGNIFSVDDLWDCWITAAEPVHWAAPSLSELIAAGQADYAINLLEMSIKG